MSPSHIGQETRELVIYLARGSHLSSRDTFLKTKLITDPCWMVQYLLGGRSCVNMSTHYHWCRQWRSQPCCATQTPPPRGYDVVIISYLLRDESLTSLLKRCFFNNKNYYVDELMSTEKIPLGKLTTCECEHISLLTLYVEMSTIMHHPSPLPREL